jgi:hypothetical protein
MAGADGPHVGAAATCGICCVAAAGWAVRPPAPPGVGIEGLGARPKQAGAPSGAHHDTQKLKSSTTSPPAQPSAAKVEGRPSTPAPTMAVTE